MIVIFAAPLWLYSGKGAWYFVTLPVEDAEKIKFFSSESFTGMKKNKGWGSIRVNARIGNTEWQTSLFPDSKSGSFLLPVKADVRYAERLEVGEEITVRLQFQSL